jgi:hypothetical protein
MRNTERKKSRTPAADVPRCSLVLLWDWRAANTHLFPSDESLRWHLRKHRTEYVNAGALVRLTDRDFVSPKKFVAVLMVIGRRAAAMPHVHSEGAAA